MNDLLKNKNVVLGVSLANKVFDAKFCAKFYEFLITSKPRSVFVFLGDEIERINYTTFGKMSMEDATHTSITRGLELARMFFKALRNLDKIDTYDYGKFLHILDAEGNKIQLWEPID